MYQYIYIFVYNYIYICIYNYIYIYIYCSHTVGLSNIVTTYAL